MSDRLSVVAIVPMKPLAESKSRLRGHLSKDQRAALSLTMLTSVLRTLRVSGVTKTLVVGGDEAIRSTTVEAGAEWIHDRFLDLNLALGAAISETHQSRSTAMYVPSDLPFLMREDVVLAAEQSNTASPLVLCPAHDGGTNGMVVPPDVSIQLQLGLDSFDKHTRWAERNGIAVSAFRSPGFERDLDTVDDLIYCIENGAPALEGMENFAEGYVL